MAAPRSSVNGKVPVFLRHFGLARRVEWIGDAHTEASMIVRFWGVRGSIASPGPDTKEVGGNTSSVEVLAAGKRFLLDAGTGLRNLGQALMREGGKIEATLLLSHYHWDHIQGLPFFVPLYVPGTELEIVGGKNGLMSVRETLEHQMKAPVFPVRLDEVGARLRTREVQSGDGFTVGDVTIRTLRGNHPGGVHAYRLEAEGCSVVYATDIEHYACVDESLRRFAEGADLLIYDSQYTEEEYAGTAGAPPKVGWGHSTYVAGCELARAAGVGKYVLFHHDPARTDAAVARLEEAARQLFPDAIAAREGLLVSLGEDRGERAA